MRVGSLLHAHALAEDHQGCLGCVLLSCLLSPVVVADPVDDDDVGTSEALLGLGRGDIVVRVNVGVRQDLDDLRARTREIPRDVAPLVDADDHPKGLGGAASALGGGPRRGKSRNERKR